MMEHTLITIGRQFGSGGHEVGNRLAERLDIPLYDHNLLRMAARELGVSDEDVAKVDETMLGRFLSGYVAGSGEYTAFMSGEEVRADPETGTERSWYFCRKMCRLCSGRLFKCDQYIYLCI